MNNARFRKYISHGNAVHYGILNPNPVYVRPNRYCALLTIIAVASALGLIAATYINKGF